MSLFSVITQYHKAFRIIIKKGDDKHSLFLFKPYYDMDGVKITSAATGKVCGKSLL